MTEKEKIIGIDLGTSNSQAAVVTAGKPTIIPSAEGATVAGKMFPSVVAFTKDNQILVGEPARRQAVSNPKNTIFAAKRKIGSDYKYNVNGKEYTPQQISAFILQKIKRDAEAFLGTEVKKVVITVPAYFNDNQRQATKDAGSIAGLDVVRIINEPTAAAMAYGLDKSTDTKVLVYDLGGGTLDVTLMEISAGTFEVLATSGDVELGGVDMDNALINYVVNDFKTKENFDISKDNVAMQRIRDAVEKAKIELSTVLETEINLPYITVANNAPKNLDIKISRATLENLVRPIIEKSRQPILNVLKDAGIEKEKVSKIILVGGPTRMPIVQKFLIDIFGDKLEKGVDPMEAVALGAAIQGAVLAGDIKDIVLLDVTPLTLSIETLGGVSTPIIERNSTIPIKASKVFSTADDYQTSVTINVIQGERPLARDNISLGSFNLEGIPPAPRGVPQIEVTFDIDANGILSVSAKDKATGKTQKITISAPHKLSKEEIEKMMQAAKENEENDKKIKELIEAKNNISALSYSLEKTLNDFKDKITDEEKNEADEIIKKIKEDTAKEDVTLDQINEDKDKLTAVINKLSSKIYSQKDQSAPGAEQQGPQNDENNGTQDGEGNSES
ncbi:MAG: Chaperone protein dnaK [Candidatus Parvarchaeum acidiphilum ARMAN-4_'5-way FS']|jgi:molecular chaperone DnaK|uniref:Chaperone protein DnaK n=1 Tax=Candidatus Parvarchaeum acidiphilum ARMAN-4_'5-way FS' TaxID=994837 RepID=F2UTU5_PARA4|nr:MAG: Chaperone protein dnaK [Candidatus Parvarchaeum acidiphilum ARMAN-4_'5-way FS']